jgi:hypothetical protein
MRRVLLASLLVVAVACGSGGGGGGGGKADAQVTFTPDPLRTGAPVTFTVTVTNDTTKALDLTFSTGQRADVTLSQNGTVVYQWSRGTMFTQMVGHEHVDAGGNHAFTLEARTFDVPAGTYSLHAVVTSSDHMDLGVTRDVTVRSS